MSGGLRWSAFTKYSKKERRTAVDRWDVVLARTQADETTPGAKITGFFIAGTGNV